MTIKREYLTVNEYSRPGRKLRALKAIVMHWTANANANEDQNAWYFEVKKTGMSGYGSAHFIVGQSGNIRQCIPEDEVAYHCGSSQPDPESGKIYTDEARARFGIYASANSSPNNCTIGIELCNKDEAGNFTSETIKAAVELCVYLLKKYRLTVKDITTHHNIVGWKNCPKLWTEKPELFEAFKQSVEYEIERGAT